MSHIISKSIARCRATKDPDFVGVSVSSTKLIFTNCNIFEYFDHLNYRN